VGKEGELVGHVAPLSRVTNSTSEEEAMEEQSDERSSSVTPQQTTEASSTTHSSSHRATSKTEKGMVNEPTRSFKIPKTVLTEGCGMITQILHTSRIELLGDTHDAALFLSPDERRSSSIAALRAKAKEHVAVIEQAAGLVLTDQLL